MMKGLRVAGIMFLFSIFIVLSACGGGGGGDSSGGGGETASITSENATELTSTAYDSGAVMDDMGEIFDPVFNNGASVGEPRVIKGAGALLRAANGIHAAESMIINGTCSSSPGSATASATQTQDGITGTITFNDFCVGTDPNTVTADGSVDITLIFANNSLTSGTFVFNDLSITKGTETKTIDGTVSMSESGSTQTVDMDVHITEGGNVHDIEYTISETDGESYTDVSMEGTFTHPTHGIVTVVTETAFRYEYSSGSITAGKMIVSGSNNTKAKLEITAPNTYTVSYSTDGGTTWASAGGGTIS